MQGLYIVFEGSDGSGKTSTMKAVAERVPQVLQEEGLPADMPVRLTHHPGSTALGAHLRKLVKQPETIDPNIEIDTLSRQILYMVDTVSFVKTILIPSLEQGVNVFADRSSFISAIVYGCAEGMSVEEVLKIRKLLEPPKADRLYILRCPWEVAKERMMQDRGEKVKQDYFDRKSDDFFNKVVDIYDHLLTGPPERTVAVSRSVSLDNVIYIDATQPVDRVVDEIIKDFRTVVRNAF